MCQPFFLFAYIIIYLTHELNPLFILVVPTDYNVLLSIINEILNKLTNTDESVAKV